MLLIPERYFLKKLKKKLKKKHPQTTKHTTLYPACKRLIILRYMGLAQCLIHVLLDLFSLLPVNCVTVATKIWFSLFHSISFFTGGLKRSIFRRKGNP